MSPRSFRGAKRQLARRKNCHEKYFSLSVNARKTATFDCSTDPVNAHLSHRIPWWWIREIVDQDIPKTRAISASF